MNDVGFWPDTTKVMTDQVAQHTRTAILLSLREADTPAARRPQVSDIWIPDHDRCGRESRAPAECVLGPPGTTP